MLQSHFMKTSQTSKLKLLVFCCPCQISTIKLKISLYFSVMCMAGSDLMIKGKTLTLILLLFLLLQPC